MPLGKWVRSPSEFRLNSILFFWAFGELHASRCLRNTHGVRRPNGGLGSLLRRPGEAAGGSQAGGSVGRDGGDQWDGPRDVREGREGPSLGWLRLSRKDACWMCGWLNHLKSNLWHAQEPETDVRSAQCMTTTCSKRRNMHMTSHPSPFLVTMSRHRQVTIAQAACAGLARCPRQLQHHVALAALVGRSRG